MNPRSLIVIGGRSPFVPEFASRAASRIGYDFRSDGFVYPDPKLLASLPDEEHPFLVVAVENSRMPQMPGVFRVSIPDTRMVFPDLGKDGMTSPIDIVADVVDADGKVTKRGNGDILAGSLLEHFNYFFPIMSRPRRAANAQDFR